MLKTIPLLFLLFPLIFLTPALADEDDRSDTITVMAVDTTLYIEEEEYQEGYLKEQTQTVYYKDSVSGKSLDSLTWKNLTKDLSYGDTLDADKPKETDKPQKEASWNSPSFHINSTLTKYILFAIVIAALLYLLYRLIGSAMFAADNRIVKAQATFEILHDDEQMMQKDLSSILAEALRQKDYKTAIRILFIQSLQDLQQYEWIQWKKEKTNRDYLNELMQREAFVPFGSMVLLYERAWYSESVATQEDFDAFNSFKQQLRRT